VFDEQGDQQPSDTADRGPYFWLSPRSTDEFSFSHLGLGFIKGQGCHSIDFVVGLDESIDHPALPAFFTWRTDNTADLGSGCTMLLVRLADGE